MIGMKHYRLQEIVVLVMLLKVLLNVTQDWLRSLKMLFVLGITLMMKKMHRKMVKQALQKQQTEIKVHFFKILYFAKFGFILLGKDFPFLLVHILHNFVQDSLQSLLCIGSVHNKCGPHCQNFAFLKTVLN